MAEGGGLLNRYRVVKPIEGSNPLRLRQCPYHHIVFVEIFLTDAGRRTI